MKGFVDDLVALVGDSTGAAQRVTQTRTAAPAAVMRVHTAPVQQVAVQEVVIPKAKEVTPEQVIPMSDNDFKDF